jgi:beta-phosphoglucomutase
VSSPSRLSSGLALLFDMDGVIVDSNPVHRVAWERFNRRYGVETTEEMHRFMYGRHNSEIVRGYFGEGLAPDEVFARGAAKEQLYREIAAEKIEEMLVPGVREFLYSYPEIPKGVASNAESANVRFILERSGLGSCFQAVVSGGEVRRPKPDPEIFLRAAAMLVVRPENCIVFEDSLAGVQAGLAARMRVVGIRTTYVDLPGTSIKVDNFLSNSLRTWLADQSEFRD